MSVRIESHAEPIPGYRLIERLGGGGFGEVWKAVAPGGLLKAIKFVYGDLQTGDDEDGIRAEQELKALSRVKTVRHPYILSLERYDIIDGQLLIVMELADRNLWDRFRECQGQGLPGIPRAELLGYLEEISEALDLMNKEYQLQHLDIKPQNLFLVHNHIKVADFGLVKDLEGMVASVTGGVTPVYAAPETFDGWVSRFCDQYSLAIVYQELLTGRRPFTGATVRQLILQHLQGTPDLSPLPLCDRAAVGRALAKNPEERHPSCQVLVKALRNAESSPCHPEGPTAPEKGSDPLNSRGQTPFPGPAPAPVEKGPVTRWIHAHDEGQNQDRSTDKTSAQVGGKAARPTSELVGDGVLFPALVIGLGQMGLGVLKGLTRQIADRFGGGQALPNVRLLYIDTDPDCVRLATGTGNISLQRNEVLRAPLFRPSHYLKPREGKGRIEDWLHPKMLYRIPRQAFSAGMRALGRLAFVDNYGAIALRLRSELQACMDPEALAEAIRQTGLGLRINRPRVYVVTSLAGGTGSGMFLDLAYVVRTLLKQLGVAHPEVAGLFLLPRVDSGPTHASAVGNAYAALTELNHFSAPGTIFSANYDSKDVQVTGPISDPEPPFTRCIVLPMPPPQRIENRESRIENRTAGPDPQKSSIVDPRSSDPLALISHFLVSDLTTSLGRSADMGRREQIENFQAKSVRPKAKNENGLLCQTFGMHRVVWPRAALLREAARHLSRDLVKRWMSKDSKPVLARVQEWVHNQWAGHELGAERLIADLQQACDEALGKRVESAFADAIDPIASWHLRHPGKELELPVLHEVFRQLEQWLGSPPPPKLKENGRKSSDDRTRSQNEYGNEDLRTMALLRGGPEGGALLEETLRRKAEDLVHALGQKLAELAVCLIEQSTFRLAGAEGAIRQMSQLLDQALQHQEQLAKELADNTLAACEGIGSMLKSFQSVSTGKGAAPRRAGLGGWWGGGDLTHGSLATLSDLIRTYAKSRYQSLILQRVIAIYVCLRGQLSDQMREVGFCRSRLHELSRSLETRPPELAVADGPLPMEEEMSTGNRPSAIGNDSYLFPAGCANLEEAVGHLLGGVSPEDLNRLDQRMETVVRGQFTALVHVCLTSCNMLKELAAAMLQEAEHILEEKLVGANVVDMYLAQVQNAEPGAGIAEREGPDAEDAPPSSPTIQQAIAGAYQEAAPELRALVTPGRMVQSSEILLLAAPRENDPGPSGSSFRDMAREAVSDHALIVTDTQEGNAANEILFYREEACLRLSDLKLLGPQGREAYRQMNNVEHFTPHTRIDITDWYPAGNQ